MSCPQVHFSDGEGTRRVHLGPWTACIQQAFGLVPFSLNPCKVVSDPGGKYTSQRTFPPWLSSAVLVSEWTTWMFFEEKNVHSVRPPSGSVPSGHLPGWPNQETHSSQGPSCTHAAPSLPPTSSPAFLGTAELKESRTLRDIYCNWGVLLFCQVYRPAFLSLDFGSLGKVNWTPTLPNFSALLVISLIVMSICAVNPWNSFV